MRGKLSLQHVPLRVPITRLSGAATELAQLPFLDPDGKSWLLEQADTNMINHVSSQTQGNHLDYRSNGTIQRTKINRHCIHKLKRYFILFIFILFLFYFCAFDLENFSSSCLRTVVVYNCLFGIF